MTTTTDQAVTKDAGRPRSGPPGAGEPAGPARTVTVTVRYFAAARAAAGVDEEPVRIPPPATVSAVIAAIGERHGEALTRVLARCSYLLGATAVRDRGAPVQDGDEVDVLPPFAGG